MLTRKSQQNRKQLMTMDCYNRRKMDNKYQFVQKQSIINNSKTLFLLFLC